MKSPRLLLLACLLSIAACRDGKSAADAGLDPDGGMGDADASLPSNIEVCDVELAPTSDGICDVVEGTGSAVLIRGDVLGDGTVYEKGSVLYSGTSITCVGCDCVDDTATVITCPGAAISPGLINPHDHITFTEGHPIDVGTKRYDHRHQWRAELSTPSNPNGNGNASAGNRWGELRMLFSGVTTLVGSGRADKLIRNLDRLESADSDLGFEEIEFETFSLGDSNSSSSNRPDCSWNFKFDEREVSAMHVFEPHVSEGIDEYANTEFRCQSSSFDNAQDFTEKNATHIHSIGLSTTDYFNMARDKTRLVWSPRSNISLYGHTAQVRLFDTLGGVVALGTDWTYSGSANMLRELGCAAELNRNYYDSYFTDEDLWKMATQNAAIATGSDTLIGTLAVGKLADIAIFSSASHRYHSAVLSSDNESVALVIKNGDVLYGETDLVSALGRTCETLDVCGTTRAVCADAEFGQSYDAIASAVAGSYPAIFCGAPQDEPTCVPSRPGEFTGGITGDDGDGDGIANASDNCPAVFNPVRPIDGGAQPDLDGDGIGDACDASPLPADLDHDGVDNDSDNCPLSANDSQQDSDEDNKGDACDYCPAVGNPDSVCPRVVQTVTIDQIQDGTITEGAVVSLTDVTVTAVWSSGFWVQDPNIVGAQAGIQVFAGGMPMVAVNDVVDLEGTVAEFFGDTQIEADVVTDKGVDNVIAPTPVTVAQAATEEYEGQLVRLTDASAFVDPYDCSADEANCQDESLWQINGSILVYDRAYQDADWAAHTSSSNVVGVMQYRFNRRRILPRTAADFAAP